MKSIFDHKRYHRIDEGHYWKEPTIFTKEINDLIWMISPVGEDCGVKYHQREMNLNLLEDKIDSDNYQYEYFGKTTVYEYSNKRAYIRTSDEELGSFEDRKQITFNEFCNYIKENEKHI